MYSLSGVTMNLADTGCSRGESESMVFPWGPSVYHYRLRHGRGHDTRTRISLLGAGTEEIRSDHDLGYHGLLLRHYVPMVLLGLFASVFGTRDKRFHW